MQAGVLITTYSMISFAGQRSEIAKKIIDTITNREWGFMLLDEVRRNRGDCDLLLNAPAFVRRVLKVEPTNDRTRLRLLSRFTTDV